MAKTPDQIIKIIEQEEVRLRRLDLPITVKMINGTYEEVDLNLSKDSLQAFLLDFYYWNNLAGYDSQAIKNKRGYDILKATYQQKSLSEKAYYCPVGARRSIGDLFRLAIQYYSQDVTLLETMKEMYNIVQNEIRYVCRDHTNFGTIYMQVCSTINRRVFCGHVGVRPGYSFSGNNYNTTTSNLHDEFPNGAILGTDYNTLFDTSAGKKLVEEVLSPKIKIDQKDLDKLVMEKLAKLRGMKSVQSIYII